jgi:hypothetical protein
MLLGLIIFFGVGAPIIFGMSYLTWLDGKNYRANFIPVTGEIIRLQEGSIKKYDSQTRNGSKTYTRSYIVPVLYGIVRYYDLQGNSHEFKTIVKDKAKVGEKYPIRYDKKDPSEYIIYSQREYEIMPKIGFVISILIAVSIVAIIIF